MEGNSLLTQNCKKINIPNCQSSFLYTLNLFLNLIEQEIVPNSCGHKSLTNIYILYMLTVF